MLYIFANKSAWFSTSVGTERKNIWMRGGGTLADAKTANFLFSEDADVEDTKRIFASPEYESITVFHASVINKWHEQDAMEGVVLGNYVLPPTPVQVVVRQQFGMEWENATEDTTTSRTNSDSLHMARIHQLHPDYMKGMPHVLDLPAVQGPLEDFIPGKHGFTVRLFKT